MYSNIGQKLKGLATLLFALGVIASVISGISALFANVILGIVTIVIGSLASWISSWVIYAIGEIAENTEAILRQTRMRSGSSSLQKSDNTISAQKPKNLFSNIEKKETTAAKTCPFCGELTYSRKCEMCGKENELF